MLIVSAPKSQLEVDALSVITGASIVPPLCHLLSVVLNTNGCPFAGEVMLTSLNPPMVVTGGRPACGNAGVANNNPIRIQMECKKIFMLQLAWR